MKHKKIKIKPITKQQFPKYLKQLNYVKRRDTNDKYFWRKV